MIEPKFEIVVKRQVAITLVGEDVDNLQKVLEAAESADIEDRRLYGFASKLCSKIEEQRKMVAKLDEEDRQKALRQLLDQYEETAIVDLTEVVPEDKGSGLHPDLDQSRVDLGVNSKKDNKDESRSS